MTAKCRLKEEPPEEQTVKKQVNDEAVLHELMATELMLNTDTCADVELEPEENHHHHYQAVLERVMISNAAS